MCFSRFTSLTLILGRGVETLDLPLDTALEFSIDDTRYFSKLKLETYIVGFSDTLNLLTWLSLKFRDL